MTRSEAASKHKYRLRFLPSAWAEWQALDGAAKEPFRDLLKTRLDNPRGPDAALHGKLRGFYEIKLRKQGLRLVYGVEDDALIVVVMAVAEEGTGTCLLSRATRHVPSLPETENVPSTFGGIYVAMQQ